MDIKNLMLNLNQRPVAYYPIYAKLAGSVNAGILLSQLLYWYHAMQGNEFYKVDAELMEETGMSEKELRNAKGKVKALSFTKVNVKGVPAMTYYSFDLEDLAQQISAYESPTGRNKYGRKGGTSIAERAELDAPNGRNLNSRKGGTITETKQRLTSQTTAEREVPNPEKTTNWMDGIQLTETDAGQDTLNAQNVKEKKKSGEKEKKADGRTILRDESFIGEMEDFAGKYINVKYEMEKMADYIASSGKQYKDYKAFARNWIRRAMEGKQKDYEAKQPTAIVSKATYNEVRERLKAKYGDKYTFND